MYCRSRPPLRPAPSCTLSRRSDIVLEAPSRRRCSGSRTRRQRREKRLKRLKQRSAEEVRVTCKNELDEYTWLRIHFIKYGTTTFTEAQLTSKWSLASQMYSICNLFKHCRTFFALLHLFWCFLTLQSRYSADHRSRFSLAGFCKIRKNRNLQPDRCLSGKRHAKYELSRDFNRRAPSTIKSAEATSSRDVRFPSKFNFNALTKYCS